MGTKLSYKEVKAIFESKGFILLSTQFGFKVIRSNLNTFLGGI
jgi:hypothetical protein